jgi:hypothetical protein
MPAKGSGMFGPDVIVGSAQYWKLWREKNKDKMRLTQMRYRARQQELSLAVELAAGVEAKTGEKMTVEQALTEVRDEILLRKQFRAEKLAENIIAPQNPNEFIAEEAARLGIPYDEHLANMTKKMEELYDFTKGEEMTEEEKKQFDMEQRVRDIIDTSEEGS